MIRVPSTKRRGWTCTMLQRLDDSPSVSRPGIEVGALSHKNTRLSIPGAVLFSKSNNRDCFSKVLLMAQRHISISTTQHTAVTSESFSLGGVLYRNGPSRGYVPYVLQVWAMYRLLANIYLVRRSRLTVLLGFLSRTPYQNHINHNNTWLITIPKTVSWPRWTPSDV